MDGGGEVRGCKDRHHPQEELLRLQLKIYVVASLSVGFSLMWNGIVIRVTSAIAKRAEKEKDTKDRESSKGEGREGRENQGHKTRGSGWEDGYQLNDKQLVERWMLMNMGRQFLVFLAGIFGGLGLWALGKGVRVVD
jgi:hypothetical protein